LLKTSGTRVQEVAFPVESILVDFVQEQTPRKKTPSENKSLA
jgi:hypothetical protein